MRGGAPGDVAARPWTQRSVGLLVLVVILLGATACRHPSDHDSSDAVFAVHMVPHHELGVRLIELAAVQADDVRLRELAFEMSGYHRRELTQLRGWRTAWSRPSRSMPLDSMGPMGTMDIAPAAAAPSMPLGMLTDAELADLSSRSGRSFDRRWLELMIRHHEGGVAMADLEVRSGRCKPALALAATISSVQREQITAMHSLLGQLG